MYGEIGVAFYLQMLLVSVQQEGKCGKVKGFKYAMVSGRQNAQVEFTRS